ncbi:ATPase F0F1 [Paenibacillus tengchongensis]|uniref:ATPase F0F1 n=1 Tax=Paenibacillus tengchongensis TaxID=2608684 RepID=UPI00124DDFCA|nr:ATPase F0F1 [Paenibacillus tengchongensis]
MKEQKDGPGLLQTALVLGSAGTLLAAYILIGFFAARWFQHSMDGPKGWLAVGTIAGLVLGSVNVVFLIKKFLGEQNG